MHSLELVCEEGTKTLKTEVVNWKVKENKMFFTVFLMKKNCVSCKVLPRLETVTVLAEDLANTS